MNSYLKTIKFAKGLYPLLNQGHKLDIEDLKIKSAEFRETLQNLGPTYIKFGQILSVRYDLLHYETCQELQKLLDSGEPILFSTIFKILRQELGQKLDNEIRQIDPTPIAVASLGQVHVGYLRSGQKIAIKVQKPGIRKIIKKDVNAIKKMLRPINLLPFTKKMPLQELIKEFETWTYKELDYSIEATNTEKFAKLFQGVPSVYVPKVYRNLLTDKVLITEFVEGVSLKRILKALKDSNEDFVQVDYTLFSRINFIEIGKSVLYKQIFKDGFFHADPHPSNIIVKSPITIAFIDFGIVGKVSQPMLKLFKELIVALSTNDHVAALDVVLELDKIKETKADTDKLIDAISDIFSKYDGANIEECSLTKTIFELAFRVGKLGIEFPTELVLMFKVLATYEGLIQQMDPTINLFQELEPLIKQELTEQLNPLNNTEKTGNMLKDLYDLSVQLPKSLKTLANKIETEGVKVNSTDRSVEYAEKQKTTRFKTAILFLTTALSFAALLYTAIQGMHMLLFGIEVILLLGVNWVIISTTTLLYILKD